MNFRYSVSSAPGPEDWRTIHGVDIFSSLSREDLVKIAGTPRCERSEKGRTLFLQGDPPDFFFVVLEGWVSLLRDEEDGSRTILRLAGPGDSFAEIAAVENAACPVSAEAATSLRLARFDGRLFREQLLAHPSFCVLVISTLAKRVQRLLDQIQHLKTWSLERRVAETLLSMRRRSGVRDDPFALPLDHAVIAAYLGMAPSTFSRALKKLSHLGVRSRYGRIAIEDAARLAAFVAEGR